MKKLVLVFVLVSGCLWGASLITSQLITHGEFLNGFTQKNTIPNGPNLVPLSTGQVPIWSISEFWSQAGISGPTTVAGCQYSWANAFKSINLNCDKSGTIYNILLAVNTEKEYNNTFKEFLPNPATGQYDAEHKKWVHLGAGRNLTSFNNIAAFSSIRLSLTAKLIFANILNPSNCPYCQGVQYYSSTKHKLHITHQVVVRNLQNGQGATVILPIYSSSEAFPPEWKSVDPVMGILMYRLPQKNYILTKDASGNVVSPQSKNEFTMQVDILSEIKKAIDYGCKNPVQAPLFSSCKYSDYTPVSIGFGWEAPGVGTANLGIRNYSLEFK